MYWVCRTTAIESWLSSTVHIHHFYHLKSIISIVFLVTMVSLLNVTKTPGAFLIGLPEGSWLGDRAGHRRALLGTHLKRSSPLSVMVDIARVCHRLALCSNCPSPPAHQRTPLFPLLYTPCHSHLQSLLSNPLILHVHNPICSSFPHQSLPVYINLPPLFPCLVVAVLMCFCL